MRDAIFSVSITHTHTHSSTLRCKCPEPLRCTGAGIYQIIVAIARSINGLIFATIVTILTWVKTVGVMRMLASAGQGVRRNRSGVVYILLRDGKTHNAVQSLC